MVASISFISSLWRRNMIYSETELGTSITCLKFDFFELFTAVCSTSNQIAQTLKVEGHKCELS